MDIGTKYDKHILIRVDQRIIDAVDKLRVKDEARPTRSEVIRRLILEAAKRVR